MRLITIPKRKESLVYYRKSIYELYDYHALNRDILNFYADIKNLINK